MDGVIKPPFERNIPEPKKTLPVASQCWQIFGSPFRAPHSGLYPLSGQPLAGSAAGRRFRTVVMETRRETKKECPGVVFFFRHYLFFVGPVCADADELAACYFSLLFPISCMRMGKNFHRIDFRVLMLMRCTLPYNLITYKQRDCSFAQYFMMLVTLSISTN